MLAGKYAKLMQSPATAMTIGGLGAAGVSLASNQGCLLYTSPSPRDGLLSRMPSSA